MLTLAESVPQTDSDPSATERRRGLRIQQARPIKVFEPTVSRYFGGQTQDVSTTGLRLELPSSMPLRPGRLLSIHVGVGDSGQPLANRRQMIPARIVWVSRGEQPAFGAAHTVSAGVEFLATISAQADAA